MHEVFRQVINIADVTVLQASSIVWSSTSQCYIWLFVEKTQVFKFFNEKEITWSSQEIQI